MSNQKKYSGIFPAFYACYDDEGRISPARTAAFADLLIKKGVNGLYVGGSSGECIYQHPQEREIQLEAVMEAVAGRVPVIAHVACCSTEDSVRLAVHAQKCGVDAIAALPPIYFHLPDHAIASYWNTISHAAPDTDFFIYNIPQLAHTALTPALFRTMLANPRVKGVKNSSSSAEDIARWKDVGGEDFTVFNGSDEQLAAGLAIGADGGIGGTYGVMPEVYLKIFSLAQSGDYRTARHFQYLADRVIYAMCSLHGNMYAVEKEMLRRAGMDIGKVRAPLPDLDDSDLDKIGEIEEMTARLTEEAKN